jgi:hypothetical protein
MVQRGLAATIGYGQASRACDARCRLRPRGLLSRRSVPIVRAMNVSFEPRPLHRLAAALLVAATAACGGGTAADPNDREISWAYGPTAGGATAEHVAGTGKDGGAAIAKGWQCRLRDGKRLVVRPYQLAPTHPLFGKVVMSFGLFDKAGQQIGTVLSPTVTAEKASFEFELADAEAGRLWDLVIWYRKP